MNVPEPVAPNPAIRHRNDFIDDSRRIVARINDWAMRHLAIVLGSSVGVWLAFLIPLIAFDVPELLSILGLVSSYWIQLWALFVLQNRSNVAARASDAKADADHLAQTHIANTTDDNNEILKSIAHYLETMTRV